MLPRGAPRGRGVAGVKTSPGIGGNTRVESGGEGGSKGEKGEGGFKNDEKWKVLRMRFSIAENVRTPSDSLLSTSRASQLPYGEKSKNPLFSVNFYRFLVFSRIFLFPPLWLAPVLTPVQKRLSARFSNGNAKLDSHKSASFCDFSKSITYWPPGAVYREFLI